MVNLGVFCRNEQQGARNTINCSKIQALYHELARVGTIRNRLVPPAINLFILICLGSIDPP